MKKTLLFITVLLVSLLFFFSISEVLFAFEWADKGITVKNREQTEEGTRVFLENKNQKSFVVVYGKNLLTDPVKEEILAMFSQITDTYNLPTSNIEFKIKPSLFQANLVLSQTGEIIGITNYGLKPAENLIPTISVMFNEFTAWKNLKLRNLQVITKWNSFQTVVTPEEGTPIINLQYAGAQPKKKFISDLAVFYNEVNSWKGLKPGEIEISVSDSMIYAAMKDQNGKSMTLNYDGPEFDAGSLKKISRSFNTIAGWNDLDYKQMQLTAKKGEINTVVTLNRASYKGKNLMTNLPAGLRFIDSEDLGYNFRVTSGEYFVQVMGDYDNEDKLLWQINEAVKDPILYIRKYDPEFFFRQLEGIRNRNAEVYNELKSEQQRAYDELSARNQNLKQAHERFIYGFITVENSGFMGTAEINKKAINRIVELKSSNSEMTRNQLENQLKQEKFDVSTKVIDMVLNLYFNDFNK